MTGKGLVFQSLRNEKVDKVPWVPFVGVHAGKLKGHSAQDVLQDGDKLFESLLAANELYSPDGQPVVFDLQIEAEILGCELLWVADSPPSVVSHPLANSTDLSGLVLPGADDGRLPMILDVMRRMKTAVGDHTALYGLVTGPFTLASHLRGTELFMDMILNVDFVHELMAFCRDVTKRMADLFIEAGMDVIAVVDPLISQIGPKHFLQYCTDDFTDIYSHIRAQGAFSAFFVCGDATKNIPKMCETGPDCISIDENVDIVAAKQVTDQYNITIGGNIPLTTTMLLGTQQDNMKVAIDLLDKLDHHNFILSPGCDMPYDTPIENVVGVAEAVREPDAARQLLADYASDTFDIAVELPDYAGLKRPLVEVFTLDSASCAACMYMVVAAENGVRVFEGGVDMVEYKFTSRENIARAIKLGVKNLPAIYINGQLKFSSIIPSNEELVAAIKAVLPEKQIA
jgi:uroporphyrinogen decarboxylase